MAVQILDWLIIAEPAVARVLARPEAQRRLAPFIGRERSVSAAARELGMNPNALLYHVERFVELGVLVVVRAERRTGKAIKYYRSRANGFFVPFALTSATEARELIAPLEADWHERFVTAAGRVARAQDKLGLRLWRESGVVIAKPSPPPPQPFDAGLLERLPTLSIWAALRLDQRRRNALQTELLELYQRYHQLQNDEAHPAEESHLLHLGLTLCPS